MIKLYSGTPGSGKSLYTAYEIIRLLKQKRTVIANFPIDEKFFGKKKIGKFLYVQNQDLTVNFLKRFSKENFKPYTEHEGTLIIDECAAMFNCRCWDAKGRAEWCMFFQQHRKLGYDVILISQHDRLIDRQIRAYIETEYRHRAIKNYKIFGWILSLIFGGLFVRIEKWYGTPLKCGHEYFLYNKKKAKIYDTYKIFE